MPRRRFAVLPSRACRVLLRPPRQAALPKEAAAPHTKATAAGQRRESRRERGDEETLPVAAGAYRG